MIKFPQQGSPIIQAPKGNLQGSLWSTFNIDLQENPGRIRLGKKLCPTTTNADDADIDTSPYAIIKHSGDWVALAGNKLFSTNEGSIADQFVEGTGSGIPTTFELNISDLASFDERLWASYPGGLASAVTSDDTWTERDTLSSSPHILKVLPSTNRLYYTNSGSSTQVRSIDADNVTAESPGSYYIEFEGTQFSDVDIVAMEALSDKLFLSVLFSSNGAVNFESGYVLEWDGISSTITTSYKMSSAGVRAFTTRDGELYAIDTVGRFLKYNGYGFEEIGRLPFNNSWGTKAAQSSTTDEAFFVYRNGLIATSRGTLLVLVNARTAALSAEANLENVQSGVWELDLATGSCTHKHSLCYKDFFGSTITDFGQMRINSVGALVEQKVENVPDDDTNLGHSTLLAGAQIFTDTSSTKLTGFFALTGYDAETPNEGEKRGYFVTTWIDSNEIQDTWQKLGIKHRKYLNANDKIIVKYRTTEETPILGDAITWTSTTTFTTTTNVSGYWTSGIGGEVEIILGPGSGTCAHITNIVNNAGTYTVTIDEVATGVSNGNTARANFQSWTKIAALTQQNLESEVNALGVSSERIQFKVVMHFTGDGEFHQMQVSNKPHIKLD